MATATTQARASAAQAYIATLRHWRAERGFTQSRLAQVMNYDQSYVNKVEGGRTRPSEDFSRRADEALNANGELWRAWQQYRRVSDQSVTHGHAARTSAGLLVPSAAGWTSPPPDSVDTGSPSGLHVVDGGEAEAFEVMEMMRRAERSEVGKATIEALHAVVDRLARDYPTVPSRVLREQIRTRLDYVVRLLEGRTTLAEHRDLLVVAGWLSTLLGCVQWDEGRKQAAAASRDMAFQLGKEADHTEIQAWSYEMQAWFALTEGRHRDVTISAKNGRAISSNSHAAVQLAVQEAKGWARLGDLPKAEEAMRAGEQAMNQLPSPTHPEHHFVFDPTKFLFYAAAIYQWAGEDEPAEEYSEAMFDQCVLPNGTTRWPMRFSETQVGMGIITARRGDLDAALQYGTRALGYERVSAPSLLARAQELDAVLQQLYPDEPGTREYHERYLKAQQRYDTPSTPKA